MRDCKYCWKPVKNVLLGSHPECLQAHLDGVEYWARIGKRLKHEQEQKRIIRTREEAEKRRYNADTEFAARAAGRVFENVRLRS